MAHQVGPEAVLFRALKSVRPYVVLGNRNALAGVAIGGDIELLVSDPRHAERQLVAELGTPRFVARRPYVIGMYYDCLHPDLLRSIALREVARCQRSPAEPAAGTL
jgi:hypothetical protein